jgi:hypothetical protein
VTTRLANLSHAACRNSADAVEADPVRSPLRLRLVMVTLGMLGIGAAVPAFSSDAPAEPLTGAAARFAGTHFGDGNLPAGCIVDRDEANPDNGCFHMKVGLNDLDSPDVKVAVLVPVSPTAERDMRVVRQSVEMWGGGIDHLAEQMGMQWLADGVEFDVTTHLVPVDAAGLPTEAVELVEPKIVVVATNPVGGIGIGIDPVDFVAQVGITGPGGVPCTSIPDPFNLASWEDRPGYDGHHGELGGIAVERCDATGGQICFAVNGAVDPVPGTTDFFSLYDLVSHEVGHCLTLGHVGDGAEGVWGDLPTNDIMAYSSDPVDHAKCVSTLDVEGFAVQMSQFLDVDGDGKVDAADQLQPNDVAGDGMNSFQVQNPKDHWYASPTGLPEDCPQPDWGLLPLAEQTDWQPDTVATRTPSLAATAGTGRREVRWDATASWKDAEPAPGPSTQSVDDATGDGGAPLSDLTGFTATVTPTAVEATLSVGTLAPTTDTGRAVGYGLYVGGRRFDSFVPTQGASSEVQTIDSGARLIMPAGTSTWDTEAGTVTFRIPRSYLAQERIPAPYSVFAASGVHIRTKDWVTTLDRAPETGTLRLSPVAQVGEVRDAPMSSRPLTRTVELQHDSGNAFTPQDTSTSGVPLVPAVGNVHQVPLPVTEQAQVAVTLSWDDPGSALGLVVKGGSGQQVEEGDGTVTVTVPWAKRDLAVQVIPSQVGAPSVPYTLTATMTALTTDRDADGVPDPVDLCADGAGLAASGGCPDGDADGVLDKTDRCPAVAGTDGRGCADARAERVVVLLDGDQVAAQPVMTRHGSYRVTGSAPASRGEHELEVVWYEGDRVVSRTTRTVTVS